MENTNSVQTLTSESTVGTRSNSTDEQLGFNSTSLVLTKANSKGDGIDQYVRFSRGKNKCSGVLSWEGNKNNDVYLYTARHCFEKAHPVSGVQWDFDVKSNSKPLIDTASGFDSNLNVKSLNLRSDNIEALSLDDNLGGGAKATDVVRLFQYSGGNNFKQICDTGNVVRSGFRGSFGYPDPEKYRDNIGVVKTVAEVRFDVLLDKLSRWIPNSKLSLSSHLVKLADSITMPGESGSPVFQAGKLVKTYNLDPRSYQFDCIDGIMTREITRMSGISETFYNVMSFSNGARKWSRIWATGGNFSSGSSTVSLQPAQASNGLQRLPN
jgi:hypothetical protein